jgi:hypothetical protein
MKHGDKAKSKAASKASGKKSVKTSAHTKASAKAGAKVSKASPIVVKDKKQQQASAKNTKQVSAGKAVVAGGNGKPARLAPENVGFANAIVAAAFKRAVKKYANAFRRLTD